MHPNFRISGCNIVVGWIEGGQITPVDHMHGSPEIQRPVSPHDVGLRGHISNFAQSPYFAPHALCALPTGHPVSVGKPTYKDRSFHQLYTIPYIFTLTPICRVKPFLHKPGKAGIWPIGGRIYQPVFYRVEMNIFNMPF